jgi:L-fucose mutarotase/ribose pyranase (RbsD/FucU family)
VRFTRAVSAVLAGLVLLASPLRVLSSQVIAPEPAGLPPYKVLILGYQDSLGRAFTKAVNERIGADARGTSVRLVQQREIDNTLAQGLPPGWDGRFSDVDMMEIAALINTDLLFIATAARSGETLLVRTAVRFPRRSPLRALTAPLSGTDVQAIVDSVASAVRSDTTYQRMRSNAFVGRSGKETEAPWLPRHTLTILGHQDSLGLALTKALTDRIAAASRGTNVRVTPQSDVDASLNGMPWDWNRKFSDADMTEIGKLLHTDLLVIVQAEGHGDTLLVHTGVRSPVRAPVREFIGTISSRRVKWIVDRVVSAILADSTYRRLRTRDRK